MQPTNQYPLTWPPGWPRTHKPIASRFKTLPDKALRNLTSEIAMIGGIKVIISSNAQYRADGLPYARQPIVKDTAVAVYFTRKGKEQVFACETYWRIHDNIHAIALTIASLRTIERHGASEMLERAFTGFTALPAPIVAGMKKPWREVLEYGNEVATLQRVQAHYRILASKRHPDKPGGSHAAMIELNLAREEGLTEAVEV
jgi:hypothetical protein